MRLRPRFSLRTLLLALALSCLGLGLYRPVWMPQVGLRPGASAQRFRLQGRFLEFGAPASVQYEFQIVKLDGDIPVIYKEGAGASRRRGWFRQFVEQDLSLAAEPGSYEIWLKPRNQPEIRSLVQIR